MPAWVLLVEIDDVVDGLLDEIVRPVGAAALGRHHTRLAVEPMQRVVVERVLALRDARAPLRLVADLRRTGDAGAMAGLARGLIGFGAVLRNRRGRQGGGGALDLERGV